MAGALLGTPTAAAVDVTASGTVSFTLAAGTNRKVYCAATYRHTSAGVPTVTAWTFGGVNVTPLDTSIMDGGANLQKVHIGYVLEADLPANGARDHVFDLDTAGAAVGGRLFTWCVEGVTQAAGTVVKGNANNIQLVVGPYTGAAGDIASMAGVANGSTFTLSGSWTEYLDGNGLVGDASGVMGIRLFGTGATESLTIDLTGAQRQAALVVVDAQVAAGPTIDTQPTAQKVVRNYDTRTSATFTSAATGETSQNWQEEDSVGAGTYTDITNGGIYSGATSDSLVITPTSNAKNGLRYRNRYTNGSGTTYTNAVALTVRTGPVPSATSGTTNGSGVAAPTYTTDDALDAVNGSFLRSAMTVDGNTEYTATRPAT